MKNLQNISLLQYCKCDLRYEALLYSEEDKEEVSSSHQPCEGLLPNKDLPKNSRIMQKNNLGGY